MIGQQQQNFSQLTSLTQQFQKISIGSQQASFIPKGILKLQNMSYQENVQQLAQLRQMYIDRLNQFKMQQRFVRSSQHKIQDISNDVKVQQIVGLFKRIQVSRIRAFQKGFQQKYQFNKQLYGPNDIFQLQDQTGKIRIDITKAKYKDMDVNPQQLPYGLIIKCQGEYKPKMNKFFVKKIFNPKFANQQKLQIQNLQNKCILAVNQPSLSQLQLLKNQFINKSTPQFKSIIELIIIGGLNYQNMNQIKKFDSIIAQIGQYVDTYIIPSSGEYKQHIYPLKPYHNCLIKSIIQHENNIGVCSNPQLFKSNSMQKTNLSIMVSCGQNLENLKANCSIKDQVQLMRMIIRFGHMCPSSIFSLPIQSYNIDPLVLKNIPHLMIHGKSTKFSIGQIREQDSDNIIFTRLVALAVGDMALIDLSTDQLITTKLNIN